MPPRKSNASVISNGPDDGTETTPAKATKDGTSIEDLSLPKSMIARLAKGVLPANTQIQRDALLALHKSATVFVSYIASNSNENAQSGGKKTISPQDVMAALKDCEFEDFLPRLEAELKKYNEVQCDKRNTYRRKVKEEKAAAAATREGDDVSKEGESVEGTNGLANGHDEVDDEDRPAKKFKGEDGSAVLPDVDGLDDDEMHDEQDGEQEVYEHHEEDENEDEGDEEEDEDEEAEEDGEDMGVTLVEDPSPQDLPTTTHMPLEHSDSDVDSDSD